MTAEITCSAVGLSGLPARGPDVIRSGGQKPRRIAPLGTRPRSRMMEPRAVAWPIAWSGAVEGPGESCLAPALNFKAWVL